MPMLPLLQSFTLFLAARAAHFREDFGSGWEGRWEQSSLKEKEGSQGKWTCAAGKWTVDPLEDQGLQTTEDARFYGISAHFPAFNVQDKEVIVQYTVKYEKEIECGGAYLKLGPKMEDAAVFGDPTPYYVMFGPDKCGYTQRTHLIFHYKSKNVLKKVDLSYKQEGVGTTHLYRLVLKPGTKVRVEIDGEKVYEGDVREDWEVLEPKEIADETDKKPSDWEDEASIDDPESVKPEDWDEREKIVDSEAVRPEDWDEEEDGEWEPPLKANPDYKGEWRVKRIDNPNYKGVWAARQVPNPKYEDDESILRYENVAFVGFDLWQVKSGTIFDDVLVTDDLAEADALVQKWKKLSEYEQAEKKKDDEARKAETEAKEKEASAAADDDDDDAPEEAAESDAETEADDEEI